MPWTLSKHKKYFGYVLFSISLMLAVLYVRFPSDTLRKYLQATVAEIDPNYDVSIGKAQLAFPFGVRLLKMEIVPRKQLDRNLFIADSLLLRPGIISFVRGEPTYNFDCLAYSGDLKGFFHFKERGMDTPFTTMIQLRDIHIADYVYLSTLVGRKVKGILGGSINYSGQRDLLINGTGEANLSISDGWVQLLDSVFGLESIAFDDLRIKMILDKRKINLMNVELEGRDLKGTLSGTVSLKKDLSRSSLELKGSIEPLEGLFESNRGTADTMRYLRQALKKGKISFIIRGTPAEPRIRFL